MIARPGEVEFVVELRARRVGDAPPLNVPVYAPHPAGAAKVAAQVFGWNRQVTGVRRDGHAVWPPHGVRR